MIILWESIVVFSFDPTWLVLAIGTPHHGLKVEFWVSWLEISLEDFFFFFLGFNTYNMAVGP